MNNREQSLQLKAADRIQVAFKGAASEPAIFLSRVTAVKSGEYIIEWPVSKGTHIAATEQDRLLIKYHLQGWAYCFEAYVVETRLGLFPHLKIRPSSPSSRVQRRDYVRVSASIEVELFGRVANAARDSEKNPISFSTHTVNISGGGFAIRCSRPLPPGALFDVRLKIPEIQPLNLSAKVVRSESRLSPLEEYEIGFSFIEITEADRRPILSYVIRKQQSD
jgi:c-di-GMP-binding flagellar brake protein YcgR